MLPTATWSPFKRRVVSNKRELFVSVSRATSKVLILSIGGIRSPPKSVDSFTFLQEKKN